MFLWREPRSLINANPLSFRLLIGSLPIPALRIRERGSYSQHISGCGGSDNETGMIHNTPL